MLTSRQLRGIASYWGAQCTYKKLVNNQWLFVSTNEHVVGHVLQGLQDGTIKDITLHLRVIKSLTDEELWQCAKLHGEYEEAFIDRYGDSMRMGNFQIFFDGNLYNHDWEPVDYSATMKKPVNNMGAIYSYLQSIHIYIPGTVDKEFVSLI
ncbi:hypothetical protein IC229_11860 [Spirosoma sp. BT702]|uniref:Uncharacterized protein n=1 Tax=Spirosoma profusum TaxID=2771354 RepID=A0A927ATX3_9BACT|nr:hypothetical protein [Spirosoma profusum]MBD2701337.1 hypothetical protein [Spirosoma profusum]